jgi:hypothetical protein
MYRFYPPQSRAARIEVACLVTNRSRFVTRQATSILIGKTQLPKESYRRVLWFPLSGPVFPGGRFDVLIQMENIVWIILFFDLCQTIIVGAVGGCHPISFFFGHEVHVDTT